MLSIIALKNKLFSFGGSLIAVILFLLLKHCLAQLSCVAA